MDYSNIIEDVCKVALEAGTFQREQRRTFDQRKVESKRSHDYVSYVDKESERMIVEGLRKILPEASFITEEKTTAQTEGDNRMVWIVDPLDGTTNYIHDLGPYCVCIALRIDKELVLGVVYEVVRDELYYAYKGAGSWVRKDGSTSRLCVSAVDDLDQALVLIGYPYNAEDFKELCVKMNALLYGHCASIRSLGSAEAELCYIAAGRLDVYFESFLQPWDVSAGAVILREAGGMVTDYSGTDSLWPSGREVLATNGLVHQQMLRLINEAQDTH